MSRQLNGVDILRAQMEGSGTDASESPPPGYVDSSVGSYIEHTLFDERQLREATTRASDETQAVLRDVRRRGAYRELRGIPNDFVARCDRLKQDFPNFSTYIDHYLIPELAIEQLRGGALKLMPTVFLGAPGIGKTLFAAAFCEAFDLPHARVNLETASAGFEVMGVARGWGSAHPGRLFKWIAAGCDCANGVFIFEEIDKARGDQRFDVTAPLIQLLEPTTASEIEDACVTDLKLDLRPLNYFFTANSLDGISEPVLSRLTVVEIPSLTQHQAQRIALRQYELMVKSLGLPCAAPKLTEAALEVLGEESPRRQRHLLRLALGRSIVEKKTEISIAPSPRREFKVGFC